MKRALPLGEFSAGMKITPSGDHAVACATGVGVTGII
jgi:hypothetical protein